MYKNALVSCSDKSKLSEFLKPLSQKGLRIVSTGGTAKHLRDAGIPVVDVSEHTGFEEVMDGRVKTLHPKIHMSLLARSNNKADLEKLKQYEIEPFDLVIGNLYPFENEPSIETIDVGGPSFLRAAAKSYERITVVCDPNDYEWILNSKGLDIHARKKLAAKVFSHTSAYDAMIAKDFLADERLNQPDISLGGKFISSLRYGENSQQQAAWFRTAGEKQGLHSASILQGKELSYNNLLDLDAAVKTLRSVGSEPSCVAVKHNNPCGVARASSGAQAIKNAILADPQSVFGGIIAVNFEVDAASADQLSQIFLECIIAPRFSNEAKNIFSKKKNLRLLEWEQLASKGNELQFRTILGGFLVQTKDAVEASWPSSWQVIGSAPDDMTKNNILLAWQVCAHLKSNSIAIVASGMTVGLGMGQVNRVDAVEQAIARMNKHHANVKGAVLASDAFFPFPDSIELIAKGKIQYVVQPGGSVKDEEVIAAAKNLGVNMILTGQRHFLH